MNRLPLINIVLSLFLCSSSVRAQTSQKTIEAYLLERDSLFWNAYNSCDTADYRQFFEEDVEFYHDKGGATFGVEALLSSFKKNLCTDNFRLRREAVPGTTKVFLLRNSDAVYGGILSGEHVFYVLEKGKPERLDGLAKFTSLWLLKNGVWKMSRLLSYDHGPAPYISKRKEIKLSPMVLKHLAGTYSGPQTGRLTFITEGGKIVMAIKDKKFPVYAESENLFFSKERDLVFEFTNSRKNLTVRENGAIVEELKLVGGQK